MLILKKTANIWIPILIILALVGLTMINLRIEEQVALEDPFAIRWNAARSWMKEGWSPYSEETQQAAQQLLKENNSLPNERERGYFLDPAWYIYLFIPISFVPYPLAKAIWMTLSLASVITSFFLALKLSGLKLTGLEVFISSALGALFYPMIRASISASLLPFFIMLTLLAVQLALSGQGNLAGLLMLFAIWFNPVAIFVVVFLLVYLGSRCDNSFGQILLVGFAFLMVITLILFPGWIQQWFTSLIRLGPGLEWLDTPLMGVARSFPGAYKQVAIGLHLFAFIMILVEWYGLGGRNERGVQWKLMLTLSMSYFFNPYSEGSFLLLVLPAFLIIFKYLSEKWPFSGKILFWISYLVVVFFSWRLLAGPISGFPKEHVAIVLLLPILVFLGLQYFRWWAIASPKALVESKNKLF